MSVISGIIILSVVTSMSISMPVVVTMVGVEEVGEGSIASGMVVGVGLGDNVCPLTTSTANTIIRKPMQLFHCLSILQWLLCSSSSVVAR